MYPETRRTNASDTYHGTTVSDPYQWLENLQSDEVVTWLRKQNEVTRSRLDAIPGRRDLRERMAALQSRTAELDDVQSRGARVFYKMRLADDETAKLYARSGSSEARVLVDPVAYGPVGQTSSVDYFAPSPDGTLVAFGISSGGSEDSELRVVDVATERLLPGSVEHTQYADVSWGPEGKGFFYWRLDREQANAPVSERFRKMRVYWHDLSASFADDVPVFGYGVGGLELPEDEFPQVVSFPSSPEWVFGISQAGTAQEFTLFVGRIDEIVTGEGRWRRLFGTDAGVVGLAASGDRLFLRTYDGASRFRIVEADLRQKQMTATKVVVPESDAVIATMSLASDALYFLTHRDGIGTPGRYVLDSGEIEMIDREPGASIARLVTWPAEPGALVMSTAWARAARWQMIVAGSAKPRVLGLIADSGREIGDLVVENLLAKGKDGVSIPLTVTYRKGLVKNGKNATKLIGYGAYGYAIKPMFLGLLQAWIERGGIVAWAHVRGGGARGEDWHKAAKRAKKQTSVDDYLACAEHLIDNGYTSPGRLAAMGVSAGGVVIGAAITQRPNLFGAAAIRVGVLNILRIERTAGGPANIPEYGTTKIEAEFRSLLAIDAYHAIKDGVSDYPAVFLTGGMNDVRVPVWQPAKFAARLQSAGNRPALLSVAFDDGHYSGTNNEHYLDQRADEDAFLWWQLGEPGFQPK